MSTLGKIVTVLIVIASVAVGAMMVTFAKSNKDWRAIALKLEDQVQKDVDAIESLKAAIAARNEDLAVQRQAFRMKIDTLTNTVSQLGDDKKTLEGTIRDRDTSQAKLEADITGLKKSYEVTQASEANLKTAHDKAIALADRLNEDNKDLAKKRHDLARMVEDLGDKVRRLEVQLAEVSKQANWYKQNWPGGTVPSEVTPLPSVDLAGEVKGADNTRMVAEITLGASDQVVEGMKFMVSRGKTYLGDLVITKVDENSAIGRLETMQGEVREGDNVTYDVRH